MRYFTTDGQRRAIAEEAGCREEAFELKLVWSEMSILVQARDQATTESVVRSTYMTAVLAFVQTTMNSHARVTYSKRFVSFSMHFARCMILTLVSSAVIPICLSIPTLAMPKG